jgi:pre-mRNA-processing factor 40
MNRSNDPRLQGRGAMMARGSGSPPPMGRGGPGRGPSSSPPPVRAPVQGGFPSRGGDGGAALQRGPGGPAVQGRPPMIGGRGGMQLPPQRGRGPGPMGPMGGGGRGPPPMGHMGGGGRGPSSMGHMGSGRGPPPMGHMGSGRGPQMNGRGMPMMDPRDGRGPPQMMRPQPGRGPLPPPHMMEQQRNNGPPPPPLQQRGGPMHHMPGHHQMPGHLPQQRQPFPPGPGRGPPPQHMAPPPPARPQSAPPGHNYPPPPMMNGVNMNGRGGPQSGPPYGHPGQNFYAGQPPQHHPGQPPQHQHHHPNHHNGPPVATAAHHPIVTATHIPVQQHQQQHAPTGPPVAAPTAASPVYSKEAVDQAWSEHTAPNGAKYYHNTLTKESSYDKPEYLQQKEAAATAVAATASANEQPWVEYSDANTGKKYYSNGVATTWEKPPGFASPEHTAATAAAATTSTTGSHASDDVSEPPKKKKRVAKQEKESEFTSKEEATAAFKGLLLAKDVSPKMKWADVQKTLSSNPRWELCEDVLTAGERKQALAEYQTKRANELRTIDRQERIRAREAFTQLLGSVLPSLYDFSVWNTRFADIRDRISKDDRFHMVADEATRESLFLDFCEEFRKQDERKKRNKKRDAKETFIGFLKEKAEEGVLTFASTWKSFAASLSEEEKTASRFEVSSEMPDDDRQLLFADFVTELQLGEDDKRRRIRDARRRAEKAQREAYREKLQSLAVSGEIVPTSRWRTVEGLVAADEAFGHVREQDRESPREMFEEFVDEWNESYRRDRSFLSQLVHPTSNKDIVVTSTMKYDDFTKALLDEAADSSEMYSEARRIIGRDNPISSAQLYFDELVLRAKGTNSSGATRRSSLRRREQDSSEDEGEIVEEGEVQDDIYVEKLDKASSGPGPQADTPKGNVDTVSPEVGANESSSSVLE